MTTKPETSTNALESETKPEDPFEFKEPTGLLIDDMRAHGFELINSRRIVDFALLNRSFNSLSLAVNDIFTYDNGIGAVGHICGNQRYLTSLWPPRSLANPAILEKLTAKLDPPPPEEPKLSRSARP